MRKSILTGGVWGKKAVSLGDLDNFLDWKLTGGDANRPEDLYSAVAWTFWCVNLRADAVAGIRYGVYPIDSDEDTDEFEQDFPLDLTQILWAVEAWLQLKAAAYVLKRSNRVALVDLQVLNSNTM